MSRKIIVNLNFDPSVIGTKAKTLGKGVFHYGGGKEGTTYCGEQYKIREFPDMRQKTRFTAIPEYVTCKKCQRKVNHPRLKVGGMSREGYGQQFDKEA
ncbi:MAG: hypothetical protein PHW62_01665 [Candidatus Ratteibacteria bacterium]|nr:hypothetical protein [Candidatus Ratteibacteria bacterium]